MADEFEYNPETGQAEPVKKTAPQIKAPANLKFSRFIDENTEGVYNIVIPLGEDAFFARELSDEVLEQVTERIAEDEALQMRLQSVFKGNDQVAIAKGQQEMREALKKQRLTYNEVLESALVGWTLEREFNKEAIPPLSISTKSAIARKIVEASQVGAEEIDFLAPAS